MAVKSIFRSSNPSESFQSKTFQFSLGKVCLALEKFHKTQGSHQHATDAPPTHLVPYKFKVANALVDSRPSVVDRLSTDALADVSTDASVGSDSLPLLTYLPDISLSSKYSTC